MSDQLFSHDRTDRVDTGEETATAIALFAAGGELVVVKDTERNDMDIWVTIPDGLNAALEEEVTHFLEKAPSERGDQMLLLLWRHGVSRMEMEVTKQHLLAGEWPRGTVPTRQYGRAWGKAMDMRRMLED